MKFLGENVRPKWVEKVNGIRKPSWRGYIAITRKDKNQWCIAAQEVIPPFNGTRSARSQYRPLRRFSGGSYSAPTTTKLPTTAVDPETIGRMASRKIPPQLLPGNPTQNTPVFGILLEKSTETVK